MKLFLFIALLAMPNPYTYGYMNVKTTLYSDPSCLNALTTLPATYFVTVLETYDEAYKVSYKDITGYVLYIDVVDYEPVTKFASTHFSANNDGYPVKLRNKPSTSGEVVTEIPADGTGYYYGDAEGTALIPQVGSTWHYVSYSDGIDTYRGYVYTSQVVVSDIPDNVIEKVEHDEGEELTSSPMTDTDFILITCLCVPSILIMYLIFRDKELKPRYKE